MSEKIFLWSEKRIQLILEHLFYLYNSNIFPDRYIFQKIKKKTHENKEDLENTIINMLSRRRIKKYSFIKSDIKTEVYTNDNKTYFIRYIKYSPSNGTTNFKNKEEILLEKKIKKVNLEKLKQKVYKY